MRSGGGGLNVLLGLTLLGLLLVMWLALSFETTTFWTANNMANLLRQGAMIAILAIGETFTIITGGIDLSVGAVAGFGSRAPTPRRIFLSSLAFREPRHLTACHVLSLASLINESGYVIEARKTPGGT
jgi:ABC-type xylose transport system permease subunit